MVQNKLAKYLVFSFLVVFFWSLCSLYKGSALIIVNFLLASVSLLAVSAVKFSF